MQERREKTVCITKLIYDWCISLSWEPGSDCMSCFRGLDLNDIPIPSLPPPIACIFALFLPCSSSIRGFTTRYSFLAVRVAQIYAGIASVGMRRKLRWGKNAITYVSIENIVRSIATYVHLYGQQIFPRLSPLRAFAVAFCSKRCVKPTMLTSFHEYAKARVSVP